MVGCNFHQEHSGRLDRESSLPENLGGALAHSNSECSAGVFSNAKHSCQKRVPVREHNDAQEKQSDNQSSSLIPSDTYPSPNNPDRTQQDRKRTIPWRQLLRVLEGIGILAGIAYAIVSFCMWRAMVGANRLTHEALVRSNRPWLAVEGDPQVLEPVRIGSDGAKLTLLLSIKNFGGSPALYVNLNRALDTFLVPGNQRPAESDCQTADTETRNGNGPYISPNAVLQRDINLRNPSIKDSNQPFQVSGCIAYRDQFKERIHHSTFCFRSNTFIKDTMARPNASGFTVCPNQYAD